MAKVRLSVNILVLLFAEKLLHSDLDDRALDALKEFPGDGALAVLAQFLESNLEHVSNKSAYLCGVMKTYRQKTRARGATGTDTTSQNASGSSPGAAAGGLTNGGTPAVKGPDETKIKEILDRTGYSLDVTTGQRKFGGPPPGWEGEPPGNGCEVSLKLKNGKVSYKRRPSSGFLWQNPPRDLRERSDTALREVRNHLGPALDDGPNDWPQPWLCFRDIHHQRCGSRSRETGKSPVSSSFSALMIFLSSPLPALRVDPFLVSGPVLYVFYSLQLDSYDFGEGKTLKVNVSEPKTRLFIGNIPKSKGRDEIEDEFNKLSGNPLQFQRTTPLLIVSNHLFSFLFSI